MEKLRVVFALTLVYVLIIVTVPMSNVEAQETFLWQALVSSTGEPVTSPVLEAGREYRIVAKGAFTSWSTLIAFVADAQYYNTAPLDLWIWGGGTPAPDGQSFLQIDGMPVDWGPFNDGAAGWVGHEYTIYCTGRGAPITFTIVDWIDGNNANNACHILVQIYEGPLTPPLGETAFAYGGEYATCFLSMDFDEDGKGDFKSWGWSNGPLGPGAYNFPIYAGAAKCNIDKGTLVGSLAIDYSGSIVVVTYMMDVGWTMGFAQLYVGSEPLPRDTNDDYTVAPGQYPHVYYVGGATHTVTVFGLSGDIYVVAHADVFGA